MIGRVSCADLAEFRSAYLDGALRDADRDRVLVHLADCDSCRTELDEFRQLRSLLTARLTSRTPDELPTRLLAIAAESPRRGPGVPGLPSSGRRIRRRITAAAAALGLGLAGAAGLGLAAAPAQTLAAVAEPENAAVAEFDDVVPRLPLASQLPAVLAAAKPSSAAEVPAARPAAVAAGAVLTADELAALVNRTAQTSARTSYTGDQVFYDVRGDQRRIAFVQTVNEPTRGLQLRAYDAAGVQIGSLARPAQASGRMTEATAARSSLDLLAAGRDVTARRGARVLDRPAVLVEARSSGQAPRLTRWWIDQATGLVLWQESQDSAGEVLMSSGFTQLTVGRTAALQPPTTTPTGGAEDGSVRTTASLTLSRADDLASAGWACSDRLAGLSLVRLRSDAAASPGVVHMVYSDGVDTVSVIEQHGRLDPAGSVWDAALNAYVRSGNLSSYSWQSGGSVVTVVSDAPSAVVAAVVAALPHQPLHTPTTMERVVAGWARIVGQR